MNQLDSLRSWLVTMVTDTNGPIPWVQGPPYEWGWGGHPMMWGAWGVGMMLMMMLFWVLIIVAVVLGVRWVLGQAKESRTDSALEILCQRYACGEINKEEFESNRKDVI